MPIKKSQIIKDYEKELRENFYDGCDAKVCLGHDNTIRDLLNKFELALDTLATEVREDERKTVVLEIINNLRKVELTGKCLDINKYIKYIGKRYLEQLQKK